MFDKNLVFSNFIQTRIRKILRKPKKKIPLNIFSGKKKHYHPPVGLTRTVKILLEVMLPQSLPSNSSITWQASASNPNASRDSSTFEGVLSPLFKHFAQLKYKNIQYLNYNVYNTISHIQQIIIILILLENGLKWAYRSRLW